MTMRRHVVCSLLGALLLSSPVHGQEPVTTSTPTPHYMDEQNGLTLEAAITRALEREPSLRAARTDLDVARGMRQQAGLRPNPSVSFERREETAGTDNQTSVTVAWPLDLFRRGSRLLTAERELEATQLAVADRERLLAADVRLQYGAAVAAMRDLTVATDVVTAVRKQFELTRARVQEGATAPLERDVLDVELGRLETDRLLAIGRADVAIVQLKRLLGLSPAEPLLLRDSLDALAASPQPALGADASPSTSPTGRPDLREAESRVRVAEARAEQARREGRVDVTLFGSYMRMDAGFPQQGLGPGGAFERIRGLFHSAAAGAMLTMPVLNRNQGQIAAATAQRTGAEARREAVDLNVRAEVAAASARHAQAQRALALYAGSARGLARQNLDVVAQTFQLGRATVFDLLAEQRRYLEVEQAYTNALREAWEARAAMKRALGEVR